MSAVRTHIRPLLAAIFVALGTAAAVMIAGAPALGAWGHTAVSRPVPTPDVDENATTSAPTETAVLAGGCFWGVQGVYQHVKGVVGAESGYAGGDAATADYESVSTGTTGHAESVRISYDPRQVTFGQLLRIFFAVVQDPTQLNRQGPDEGTQYRSSIFAQNQGQQAIAQSYIDELTRTGAFGSRIVTTVAPKSPFYPAESYHQNFLADNPDYPYIAANDQPKLDDLKRQFPDLYRSQPVLVATGGN